MKIPRILIIITLLLPLIKCYSEINSKTSLVINNYEIESNQIPEAFYNYKILFLSDFHINNLLPKKYFLEVIRKIEEIRPDLILFGGDLTDENTDDFRFVSQIIERLKMFDFASVSGNHDNLNGKYNLIKQFDDMGIPVLENQAVSINKGNSQIFIAGISDYNTSTIDKSKAISNIPEKSFLILLSHSPEPYHQVKNNTSIDLMLSGHTHGGQVTLFGLFAPILPLSNRKYWKGTYHSHFNKLIITNGIGVYRFSLRFFAPPGIELITLKGSSEET